MEIAIDLPQMICPTCRLLVKLSGFIWSYSYKKWGEEKITYRKWSRRQKERIKNEVGGGPNFQVPCMTSWAEPLILLRADWHPCFSPWTLLGPGVRTDGNCSGPEVPWPCKYCYCLRCSGVAILILLPPDSLLSLLVTDLRLSTSSLSLLFQLRHASWMYSIFSLRKY